jgi:hypothetical protein
MKALSEDIGVKEIIKYLNKLEKMISSIENRLLVSDFGSCAYFTFNYIFEK